MAAETTPSDAEVEALLVRLTGCTTGNLMQVLQQRDGLCLKAATMLRALLAARREADARVAAARDEGFRAGFHHPGSIDPTLATLLAEAREQGRREMREMAAVACVEEAALWTTKDIKVGLFLGEEAIRALPVAIPTPEAPQ